VVASTPAAKVFVAAHQFILAKRPVPHRTSFLGSLVEEMRLVEIEFPLDPAPRLVLQFSL
jgi:hypothetical protein